MSIDKTAVRNAATVIALRDRNSNPAILMGQRGSKAAFMPNKFVFPGGAVDQEDASVPLAAPLPDLCRDRLSDQCPADLQHALAAAAIRELWEETGLVLGAPGKWRGNVPPDWRSFAATGHVPAAGGLQFVFRALTPPGRPRRFDARFFLVDVAHISSDLDDFIPAAKFLAADHIRRPQRSRQPRCRHRFRNHQLVDFQQLEQPSVERVDDPADDPFGTELLEVRGNRKRCFEILSDRQNHCIASIHRDFVERVEVGAVGLDDVFDLVLERVDVNRIVVHSHDFMTLAGKLASKVSAETAKADDAKFHDIGRDSGEEDVFLRFAGRRPRVRFDQTGDHRQQANTTDKHIHDQQNFRLRSEDGREIE